MNTRVIPVIHYANTDQVMRNAERAFDAGCAGVFLIHMDQRNELLAPAASQIKQRWPDKLVGINYLDADAAESAASNIDNGFDMTWTDRQLTHTGTTNVMQPEATRVREVLARSPEHLMFVGVAFKHQLNEPHPDVAAKQAVEFGFIPTTSGSATGRAAHVSKIADIRVAIGSQAPLAVASGITPANVSDFAPHLTYILVATGVSSDFYEFDFEKLYQLRVLCDSAANSESPDENHTSLVA